ncbi:SRPBCC family protein [Streptomyces sp. JNUCC 64]
MPTGLTRDAGWQIGVSRTLPQPPDEVWRFVTSPEGYALWLGEGTGLGAGPDRPPRAGDPYRTADGTTGEVRGFRPVERIRLTHDTTVVQLTVSPAPDGRSVLRFHQDHMASAAEREARRTHWRTVMDRVAGELDTRPAPG